MEYNKIPILFFILFLIITGCTDTKQKDTAVHEYSNSYKFTICDSIDLPDFKEGYVTAYLPKEDAFIGVFDQCRNGKILS